MQKDGNMFAYLHYIAKMIILPINFIEFSYYILVKSRICKNLQPLTKLFLQFIFDVCMLQCDRYERFHIQGVYE